MPKRVRASRAFNSLQAVEATGVTRKQAIHWDLRKVVTPSVCPARGRGSQRLYSYEDLLLMRTARRLRELGLNLAEVRACLRHLRKYLPDLSEPLTSLRLATDGQTVGLLLGDRSIVKSGPSQGELMLIDIAAIDAELRRRAAALDQPAPAPQAEPTMPQATAAPGPIPADTSAAVGPSAGEPAVASALEQPH